MSSGVRYSVGKEVCGSGRREPSDRAYKKGLNTKVHLAVDAHGMPVRTDKSLAIAHGLEEIYVAPPNAKVTKVRHARIATA